MKKAHGLPRGVTGHFVAGDGVPCRVMTDRYPRIFGHTGNVTTRYTGIFLGMIE